ncbi:transcriptional regulator, LuxR family [Kribbella flavida DSM 17836]|uniref:Transcriptional regulator, LuxR family n=1 Tax=Kribbella flavida (strain DSM 17836 / JCM 10339 / NBRC 14399) TaxID=479435 RepID=D2PLG3_KRIFD|nr:helix-turn-helix transcriptional regulator [Kribbella flavida]ADB30592.1 transcriptional regulator, LuxR family [Kribbella flavida DSM 17836]
MTTARLAGTTALTKAPDALALFHQASAVLRRAVPFDAAVWQSTDPGTGLATAPMRAENLGEDGCATYWNAELLSEKVNLFRDLARAAVPVAALRDGTADAPEHSAVYRHFLQPRGLDDELRAVLRTDGQWWGQISLFRSKGRPHFSRQELAAVAGLTTLLARRLRSYAEPTPEPVVDAGPGPGLLLFDSFGALLSVNDEAREFLAGMPAGPSAPSRFGVPVPAWIHSTAATASHREQARVRAKDRSGRWLVFHASCLRDADGAPRQTAVVIEPAKASEVAALITAAYGLTDRELEITQLIARGLSTGQLAARLYLSQHTVRDHVKSIFAKTGVTSRGELVAKLYAEHYQPLNPDSRIRVWD